MAAKVKNVDVGGQQYAEVVDYQPHIKVGVSSQICFT